MQYLRRLLVRCFFLSTAILLGTSCSRQANKERALTRANDYFASGALDKAEIEYLNVLKEDPTTVRAIVQLGLIYADQGRIGKAPAFLLSARKLQPENLEVRAKLVLVYLAAKKADEARSEARYILEHQPAHPEAPLLFAECAQSPDEIREAQEFLQNLSSAKGAPVLTALASLEFHQRRLQEALGLLKQAQALDPKSAAIDSALGAIYLVQKNNKAAEEAFAASWQNSSVRSPKKLSYVRFKLQTGDNDGARRLLTELTTQAPDWLPPMMLLAELGLKEKKYDESLVLISKVLGRDPYHYPAMMLNIRLRLAKGETDVALRELEKLHKTQANNPEVQYQFALTYLARKDTGKAIASLNKAVELAPGYPDPVLLLADLHLKSGDAKAAVTELRSLLALRPELLPVKFLLARAYVGQGDLDTALATYQEVSATTPKDANLLLPIALIYRQQKKYAEARKTLEGILEMSRDFGPAVELLVDLDLIAGSPPSARNRAEDLRKNQPDNVTPYLLLAKISLIEKNLPQAEANLLKVIELQPDNAAAYYMLAGIYTQTKQDQKALDQLVQVAKRNPDNPSLHMRIALLHEQLKNYPAARDAYERVLALEPKFSAALNNLAYLYAEQINDTERALALAQKARDLSPLDPNIADTLGWILYRTGQYQQAKTLLLESAAKLSDDASVVYHLGMAQYMMGELEPARLALEHALEINPQLPGKTQVNQRLAILGTRRMTAGSELRAILEKAVAERKDDPVARTRLADILVEAGEFDQAQTLLNAAMAINPLNVNASLSLIRLHLARHEISQALTLAKTTRKQAPDDPFVGHQLGRIAFQIGEYQWSFSLLLESARKLPDDLNVLFDQAKSAYSVGRATDAEEAMRRILQANPDFPNAPEISSYLEMISLSNRPTADGTGKINQALKKDPTFVPALMAAGANSEMNLDSATARQTYEKALAHYPDFSPAKKSLALLAAAADESNPKDYEMALQARAAIPNDPSVAQALGILSYRKQDYSRTASLLKESIARLGDDARRTYYLGMALYRLKDNAAGPTLQRSLELGLKDDDAGEARRIIAQQK